MEQVIKETYNQIYFWLSWIAVHKPSQLLLEADVWMAFQLLRDDFLTRIQIHQNLFLNLSPP